MMPAPYNVLLEDDTYKGEIKIGLKFIANVSKHCYLTSFSFYCRH
jgi:hypothetical protein